MSPAPAGRHQRIVARLLQVLAAAASGEDVLDVAEPFAAEVRPAHLG